MATTITAGNSTNGGAAISSDNTGILELKTGSGSGTTALTIGTGQAATFAGIVSTSTLRSDSTSPPTIQNTSGTEIGTFCRAWVNFNGTGTVAIRASFNVSSITDNGTGEYTVNFTTALVDANYSINVNANMNYGATLITSPSLNTQGGGASELAPSTTSFRFYIALTTSAAFDPKYVNVSIFR